MLTVSMAVGAQTSTPGGFPVPTQWRTFAGGVTPQEAAALRSVINAQPLREGFTVQEPETPESDQTGIAGVMDLGALGRGYVASYASRSKTWPTAVFVAQGSGFRRVYFDWGRGVRTGPSGGSVPFLYVEGHLGCCNNPLTRYRYDGKQFVADGCVMVRTDDSPQGAGVTACQPELPGENMFPLPSAQSGSLAPGFSLLEFAALRPLLAAALTGIPPPQRATAIDGARMVSLAGAVAVQLPNCDALGNCLVVVFGRSGNQYRVVLRTSGTAIAAINRTVSDPLWPMTQWVIRRRTASGKNELVRYHSVPELPPAGFSGSWPPTFAPWAADACELVQGASIVPVMCADTTPVPASGR
ncbi:MAG TPA: hypothetical protein VNF74_08755 [Terriglobales bacterium]|nr:hypothetical protein [Terriglobales bacterium]